MHLIKICRARRAKRKTNSNFCHGFRFTLPSLPLLDSPDSSISALSRVAANFDFFGLHQSAEKKTEPRKNRKRQRESETAAQTADESNLNANARIVLHRITAVPEPSNDSSFSNNSSASATATDAD